MLRLTASVLLAVLWLGHTVADVRLSGDFDYYVLALSWSPSWCAAQADGQGGAQCDEGNEYGFILHGLWPQYEDGWPQYCDSRFKTPDIAALRAMIPVSGSKRLALHAWEKHGRCTGMDAATYFALSRFAYSAVKRPPVFRRLLRSIELSAPEVENAFLDSNPNLTAQSVTVTCRNEYFQDVRICLNKDMQPRACGQKVARDCRADVTFPAMR